MCVNEVSGSNPHEMPIRDGQFPTEFRIERFTPPYLTGANANKRPTNVVVPTTIAPNGGTFNIDFVAPDGAQELKVSLYYRGYVTHSVHMGERMMFLDVTGGWVNRGGGQKRITVRAPPNKNVAQPGDAIIFVLCDGVPSIGKFVKVV